MKLKTLGLSMMFAALALCAHAQTPAVGRWNLGEQDAGAVAGGAGNTTTTDAIGTNNLGIVGAPVYSSDVPAGTGSTLSMSFDGASCYQGSVLGSGADFGALYNNLDFNNFSLSCDIFITAPGGAGFSFPVSMGDDRVGGIAIVEIGGSWELIHMGVGASGGGPAITTNTWQHFDLVRKDFGSGVQTKLFINGADTGLALSSAPHIPTDFFTIGANELGTDIPGNVEGFFNGKIDNVVISNLDVGALPTLTGITAAPGTIYTGNSLILSATGVAGDTNGENFTWRLNGVAVTNTTASSITFANVTTNKSGNYDVVLANSHGAVTSSVVAVTVLGPGFSGGLDVAKYRLGEDDPGAADGVAGDATTKDAIGTADLTAFGAPIYSANAAPGGSTLSMSFDGGSYYVGITNGLANLFANLDFNNFSFSGDVYMAAPGAAGYSFPFSMGRNGTGGFALVEIGGVWSIFHQGIGQSAGVPATLNTWTHLELQRRMFGGVVQSRFFLNGVDVNASITTGPALPLEAILTIGANTTGDIATQEGLFNGQIDNVVVHDYSAGKPPFLSSLSVSPLNIVSSGDSFTLVANGVGGQLPLSFGWRMNGTTLTNTTSPSLAFTGASTNQSGQYDVVITNATGSVTSSVVTVTVLPPGISIGNTVAEYRLGEDDPGATAGAAGNAVTKDAIGTNDLTAFGSPVYSATVPTGGSTLAMAFDGSTSYYEGSALSNLFGGINFNNFSLSFDVYTIAPGSAGFSFPVSIGGTGADGGGIGVVEIGGNWELIHHMVAETSSGPVIPLNTWQHLELTREDVGSGPQTRLTIDGADSGLSITSAFQGPGPFLTIGANPNANLDAGFEGPFDGVIDNVVLKSFTIVPPKLTLQVIGGQATVHVTGKPRANITLWRSSSLTAPVWSSVASGVTDASGQLVLTDSTAPVGGAFYKATSP